MSRLVFTFDDGIRTHYDLVRPLLKEHGMTGTFFIPGKRTLWRSRPPQITESDGHDMQSSTFCYPGYHTNGTVSSVLKAMGHFKFARIGYCTPDIERGEPVGGNRPENRKSVYYYTPGTTDPMFVNSTGIFNDWYSLDHFIDDVENTPEGCVAVFTAHGFARTSRWDLFKEMVQYVADNGHGTINLRDMPG